MDSRSGLTCPICGGRLETRRDDHLYLESGLDNVTIKDMEIDTCVECGEELYTYSRLEELHRVLAFALASHPARLRGAEIRFLRKYLGWSGTELARQMGVDRSTVSRWEHGKERMGTTAERLLRMMVFRMKPIEEYPTENLAALSQDEIPPAAIGVKEDAGAWAILEAA